MIYSTKECNQFLEDLEEQEYRLSDWERNFVDSVQRQIGEGKTLSIKQRETIGNIWEKLNR